MEALTIKSDQLENKNIFSENIIEMTWFVLKNNYFVFHSMNKQQVSSVTDGTKVVSPYACKFMLRVETEFLEKKLLKPWAWLRYIDNKCFVWIYGEFLQCLPNSKQMFLMLQRY